MITTIIALALTMLLMVGVHEAGHALAARWFKVKIEYISIGFGRPLLQWQSKNGLKWIWALWPLGGSIRLLNTRIETVPKKLHQQCFDKQPIWKRVIILMAGVAANLLLAWLALLMVFMLGINLRPPVIEDVKATSLAYQAGLRPGDTLKEVNGTNMISWNQFGGLLIMHIRNSSLKVTVITKGGAQKIILLNLKQFRIRPEDKSLLSSLGICPNKKIKKQLIIADSIPNALKLASSSLRALVFFFIIILKQIFTGVIPFTLLLGPVGILEVTRYSFLHGISVFAMFVAGFSTSVAVVNILPMPGLDGGSIIYALIEKIRGKPISIALEVLLYRLAVIAFFVLLFNLLLNDLQRYVARIKADKTKNNHFHCPPQKRQKSHPQSTSKVTKMRPIYKISKEL